MHNSFLFVLNWTAKGCWVGIFIIISLLSSVIVMDFKIVLEIILLGIALSMDAFAVSITDGLIYTDINKKKSLFID